uniref:Uncharacterized protein n=1 Tax=Lactuca sativa TaxID=4236 RepID=A0A9R1X0M6_LACSA|nr:hypothetical protein LSAT_V11C700371370 [Lactuca sativa]
MEMKLFFLEVDHEGKTMLEEAFALGHLDSTFVLGMMVLAKGRHRKQEALDMLNNAYRRAKGKWNLRANCSKVHLNLNREGRKHVHFHGIRKTFAMHKSIISVSDAFVNGYKWVFRCEICLWDACFVSFSREFGIICELFVDIMLNTRSCHSLYDLPLEILSRIFVVLGAESAKDIIYATLW